MQVPKPAAWELVRGASQVLRRFSWEAMFLAKNGPSQENWVLTVSAGPEAYSVVTGEGWLFVIPSPEEVQVLTSRKAYDFPFAICQLRVCDFL